MAFTVRNNPRWAQQIYRSNVIHFETSFSPSKPPPPPPLRIGKVDDDKCPDCRLDVQDVHHLFNCLTRQTGLTVDDLWNNPREVAYFLSSHPAFDFIAPPATPPTRRRRRRGRPPSLNRTSFSVSPLSIPDSLVLSPFSLSSLSP